MADSNTPKKCKQSKVKDQNWEEKIETAKKMLEDGLDAGLISRYTGLSIDEIQKLQSK